MTKWIKLWLNMFQMIVIFTLEPKNGQSNLGFGTYYDHCACTAFLFFLKRLSIVNTEDGHSIFTLNPAAPSDAGLYKVVARNPLGQVTATIRVVLGDICGSPDSPSVEAMTDTDILLSWKTPSQLNHAPVIAYKVQMGYIGKLLTYI